MTFDEMAAFSAEAAAMPCEADLDPQPLVEWDQVEQFCQLLGRSDKAEHLVLALFPPDPSKPMIHLPSKAGGINKVEIERQLRKHAGKNLSLGMVINRPKSGQPDNWGQLPEHFSDSKQLKKADKCEKWKAGNQSWCNRPRTWGASNDDILNAPAVWFECDGGLPKEEQSLIPAKVGLPDPSFSVWTGGKSLHMYYLLERPASPAEFRHLMGWIANTVTAKFTDDKADPHLKNPARVMRLPGGLHGTQKGRCHIHSVNKQDDGTPVTYSLDQLREALPPELEPSSSEALKALPIPPKGTSKWGSLLTKSSGWFESLPLERQEAEALLMLKAHPPRLKPSAEGGPTNTRGPALKFLGGLATHFGDEKALDLARDAGWFNEWWDPETELSTYRHDNLSIGSCIYAAREHGYLSPKETKTAQAKAKGNHGDGINPPLGEWANNVDWMLDSERTTEVVIEEALSAEANASGSRWLSHHERFRRYLPERGYYENVSYTDLKRHITALLRRVFELTDIRGEARVVRRATTDKMAENCTRWMFSTVAASEMDVAPALAFTNGTVQPDPQTGLWVLGKHDPELRLTYGINGAWVADAVCPPYFHEFVRTSYGLDWLEIIRAVISYNADPRHVCRVLVLLLGLSGTGKGTLERLIEAMFPPETVATLQETKDLNSPERVAQLVAGRRLIAFPDMQGHQSGLGTLYSLTEAGQLTGRHLYSKDTFSVAFKGRVVICSTQPPSFDNAGTGIARRLLTLQTLQKPLSSDLLPKNSQDFNNVLQEEIGQLVSWALQMPAEDVEQVLQGNDPGGLLAASREEIEVGMDVTRSFIDRCLEPSSAEHQPSQADLYSASRLFSEAAGFKGVCNEGTFVSRLRGALPHLHLPRRRVNGERLAASFFGFKLREGLWFLEGCLARTSLGEDYYSSTSDLLDLTNRGWGALVKSRLGEGGLAALRQHQPSSADVQAPVQALSKYHPGQADPLHARHFTGFKFNRPGRPGTLPTPP